MRTRNGGKPPGGAAKRRVLPRSVPSALGERVVATTQQATPRAAGVAGGFVGIFSYASTVLSGVGFGFIAQRWGWSIAYMMILAAALVGGAVLTLIWRDAKIPPE